jgi:HNH endonuclease/AP2 domain
MSLTASRVRELVSYDPDTGIFRWRAPAGRWGRIPAGAEAGCATKGRDYLVIFLDGRLYQAARIAWLYMTGVWPNDEVDHIDLQHGNNKWANLREATHAQNLCNRAALKNNLSGLKGVTLIKRLGKWRAQIKNGDKNAYLGLFQTPEAAHAAYVVAATEIQGKFARAK